MSPSKTSGRRRGQIVPRSPGRFLLRVELGTVHGPDGKAKRVTRSETFVGTRAEAEKALTEKLSQLDRGTLSAKRTNRTVSEAADLWLAGRVSIGERTRLNYRARIDSYITPKLGFLKLRSLSRETIQAWVVGLSQYSPSTVRQAFTTLSQVIEMAVRDGELPSNPCAHVELPKQTRQGKPPVLPVAQWPELFPKILPEKHGPLFIVMLLSGVRPQEALALTWGNLTTLYDDATGTTYPALSIVQALTMVKRSRWKVGPVKTESSRRLVPLPASIAEEVFREQRRRVRSTGPDAYIFPNAAGSHQNPDTIYEAWARMLKRHGYPHVKLYATRHSSVTALLSAGVHPKVVAERHGHSNTSMTLEVYSHVLPSMQAGALRALPDHFDIQTTERP